MNKTQEAGGQVRHLFRALPCVPTREEKLLIAFQLNPKSHVNAPAPKQSFGQTAPKESFGPIHFSNSSPGLLLLLLLPGNLWLQVQ